MKRQDQIKTNAQAAYRQWRDRRVDAQKDVNQSLTRAKGRGACIHVSQLNGVVQ